VSSAGSQDSSAMPQKDMYPVKRRAAFFLKILIRPHAVVAGTAKLTLVNLDSSLCVHHSAKANHRRKPRTPKKISKHPYLIPPLVLMEI